MTKWLIFEWIVITYVLRICARFFISVKNIETELLEYERKKKIIRKIPVTFWDTLSWTIWKTKEKSWFFNINEKEMCAKYEYFEI